MIIFVRLVLTVIYFCMAGDCGLRVNQYPQPKRPEKIRGWEHAEFSGVHSIAELVLKKNESSNNGVVGVKVVDLLPPKPGAEPNSYFGRPRVVLKFYRVSDKEALCEGTFIAGGTGLENLKCDSSLGITAIYVNSINTQDEWVWLDLRNHNLLSAKP